MKQMVYQEAFINEVLHDGVYRGYRFEVKSMGIHPCGYIYVPKDCIALSYLDSINVHWGFTFQEPDGIGDCVKLGWDYGHHGDYSGMAFITEGKKWTTEEIEEHAKNVIDQVIELNTLAKTYQVQSGQLLAVVSKEQDWLTDATTFKIIDIDKPLATIQKRGGLVLSVLLEDILAKCKVVR
ncbi:hypothetical protein [Culicoidibacter larvae]|uniref:Uncharacterized protein n=1 Tax=Culicoidibacter larvae TaxID=2579976 RepID=A0A5R8Q7I1_9FIRM|nr:hypothetical protein [Culicoidibacter larvae]TLG71405.1 hypothetical protein FEZ08_10955 [Culicoidibacter larvae]